MTLQNLQIEKKIVEYYEELYSEQEEWRPQLDRRGCPRIGAVDCNLLEVSLKNMKY